MRRRQGVGSCLLTLAGGRQFCLPRRLRESADDIVYHVLNRGIGRIKVFEKEADYLEFQRVLEETYPLLLVQSGMRPVTRRRE